MSSLTNRIYYELNEWKFSQLMISATLEKQNKLHRWLNFVLILISLIGIAGWFRNGEYKIFWTSVLIIVQAIRISKDTFLKSSDQRFSMKSSSDFYNYHLKDLENLFYDFYDGRYSDQTIDKKLKLLQDEERKIFGNQSFGRIKLTAKRQNDFEEETDIYLKRIKNNVNS